MAKKVKPASGIGNAKAVAGPHGASVKLTNAAHGITDANWSSGISASGSALGAGNGIANPWETDPIALGQLNTARTNQGQAALQTAANRALGEQEFGLRHELGANGVYYDDYKNNPWSQAALLQHAHESNARGLLTTAGQALYSGQTGNAQGIEAGNFSRSRYGLEGEVNRAEANWRAEEQAAQKQRENEEWEAKENALKRRLEQEPPEVPLGGDGGGGGGTPDQQGGGVTKKNKQGKKIGIGGAKKVR